MAYGYRPLTARDIRHMVERVTTPTTASIACRWNFDSEVSPQPQSEQTYWFILIHPWADIRCWTNGALMSGQRRRRWTNVNPALSRHRAFTGLISIYNNKSDDTTSTPLQLKWAILHFTLLHISYPHSTGITRVSCLLTPKPLFQMSLYSHCALS